MSPWRLVARGAAPFALIVAGNAAVQSVLVALDPREPLSLVSLVLAAASGAALLGGVVLLWRAAGRAAALHRPLPALLLRSLVAGVAGAAAGVLFPPVVPLVVAAGCAVLAAGGVLPAGSLAARHPLRFTGLAVATVVAALLAWVLDLLLGLFITGPAAAGISWGVVGVASVLLVCHWTALAVRPTRVRA